MNILGVHIGHDSSAALIVDGKIVADVAEERFSRIKHDCGLPIQAVDYCLTYMGLSIEDIDAVAVPSSGTVVGLNFLFDLKKSKKEKRSKKGEIANFVQDVLGKPSVKPPIYIKNFPIKKTEIHHVEHHLAHAASAYYTSGSQEDQLIVTMDGAGDGLSTCIWKGHNGMIEPLLKLPTDASLGWFYSNVTEALGWHHGDGEGKTMGLAPYGNDTLAKGRLDTFYPVFDEGKLTQSHKYGRRYHWNERGAVQWHFDQAYAIKKLIDVCGREHIAAEAQRVLEEQVSKIIFPWLDKEKIDFLSCAGGIFLNVKLNQRLWETGKLRQQYIYPNAGDSGLASGAALYMYHTLNPGSKIHPVDDLYWGPEYSDEEIKSVLEERNLKYEFIENIEKYTAQKLADNKIIGWFQGRMESGPRALGNRSILMSANTSENKDLINAKVKFREAFRPFCPSILWEKKKDYIAHGRDEFFMITSFTCKEDKRDKVPAVVHADFTMRPQLVKKSNNERYWNLINEFGKITGEYLLLNTSFNVMGEPIVNHPREAIRCFFDSGLDYLVLGNYILSKKGW
jgi:carbamoyltransferase